MSGRGESDFAGRLPLQRFGQMSEGSHQLIVVLAFSNHGHVRLDAVVHRLAMVAKPLTRRRQEDAVRALQLETIADLDGVLGAFRCAP